MVSCPTSKATLFLFQSTTCFLPVITAQSDVKMKLEYANMIQHDARLILGLLETCWEGFSSSKLGLCSEPPLNFRNA
ncbi:uncharacterized protein P174DRAFT_446372 [Aspergillus novofumigatus IBT 16806]|uniref:Uncharacterized protein n=1 Tax=Aspergillus novofumigatus (strain IBT 16806) TaxID=1392255 RepID=A0A2I1BT05_ASPN1|nr:uncharacterized protein P174DRAFT_446372 [Aspergillus novofumigatus IBT 16806]PKX88525.1 hypothetical protein P174DRAFT_446372 [Aspergillus novofumigatus IBT 16806]